LSDAPEGRVVRVALALLTLFPGQAGGTESYVRALVRELGRRDDVDPTLLVTARVARAFAGAGVPMRHIRSYRSRESDLGRLAAMTAAQLLPGMLSREVPAGIEVLHHPVTVPIPTAPGAATVVSLHDVLHHEHPAMFSAAERRYRGVTYDRAARRADLVITVSEHARRQIVERLAIPADRVAAIPHGLDPTRFTPEPGERDGDIALPERFVLYPANLWPHKNHERLLRAFARAGVDDLHLVLTGQTYGRPLPGLAGPRVVHLGHLPHSEVPALYRRATALVFPSLFEGFGMPLVEAMASGCPVAASARGAIAETCGDAALLFDPEDEEAIAGAMRRIVEDEDLRGRLRADGLLRASSFGWDDVAARHVEVYRRARNERIAR
jgi:glycosyltransferase involved in cell wall biosynthesis